MLASWTNARRLQYGAAVMWFGRIAPTSASTIFKCAPRRCFANGDKNERQCRTQSNPSLSAGRAKHPKAKLVRLREGRLSINSKLVRQSDLPECCS